MRGQADDQGVLFHVFDVEDRIRKDHPLRDIKKRADAILDSLSPQFARAYSRTGRPSVPPERLLKALLLMALYSVRSERQLCERIDTDLLFRWFLDLQPSEDAFDATTFTHNRKRLEEHDLTRSFFTAVVSGALTAGLCSEHFSVDGTLIQSFAAAKSFQPKRSDDEGPRDGNGFQPRNAEVDFHGEKRSNETHESRTDPEARLYRKGRGKEAKLSHMGHTLSENRHGLIVEITVTEANGTAERTAAMGMLDELKARHAVQPKTLGADKGFDCGEFFQTLEERQIEPHVPLVKEPCDLETVVHEKRKPGVAARHRMKERMASEGYLADVHRDIAELFLARREVLQDILLASAREIARRFLTALLLNIDREEAFILRRGRGDEYPCKCDRADRKNGSHHVLLRVSWRLRQSMGEPLARCNGRSDRLRARAYSTFPQSLMVTLAEVLPLDEPTASIFLTTS